MAPLFILLKPHRRIPQLCPECTFFLLSCSLAHVKVRSQGGSCQVLLSGQFAIHHHIEVHHYWLLQEITKLGLSYWSGHLNLVTWNCVTEEVGADSFLFRIICLKFGAPISCTANAKRSGFACHIVSVTS